MAAVKSEDLSGKTIEVPPDRTPPLPRVTLAWRGEQQDKATFQHFTNGYMMKLVFGQATEKRIPGQIYVCVTDEAKSFVAGTFEAAIKKPPPPGKGKGKAPKSESKAGQ